MIAPYRENNDGTTVTLGVDVVPGFYYAVDSAGTMSVAERRTPTKWRDAPRIELAYGDLGLRPWGICFPPVRARAEITVERNIRSSAIQG